jgi:DNA-binding MurR/RpiR family transcriptional regulator
LQRIYRERLVARSATYRERIEQMRRTGGDKGHVLPQLVDTSIHELERLREHFDVRRLQAATESSCGKPSTCSRSAELTRSPVTWPTAWRNSKSARSCSIRVGGMLRQRVSAIGPGDVLVAASFRNYGRGDRSRRTRARTRRGRHRHHRPSVSPLARVAKVTLEIGDDPSVQFRSLVAPLCAAQALVMSVGYALAERNGRKPGVKKTRKHS